MHRKLLQLTGMAMLMAAVAVGGVGVGSVAADEGGKKSTQPTIAEVVAEDEEFSTLLTALEAADLVEVFEDPKAKYTVFAPTNDAFAEIPEADLQALLDDPEALSEVLTYHVVEGKIPSKKLDPEQSVETLQGGEIQIEVADDGATITDGQGREATIVVTDVKAKNGVIHVIDLVLLPAADDA